MKSHRFNYPQDLKPCQFCNGETVPELVSAIVRKPDGHLTSIYNLKCADCGYTTKTYEYPDIVCHAWNMAAKIEVNQIVDSIMTTPKKDSE